MHATECVCNECGRRFPMVSERVGEQICPSCGGEDFEVIELDEAAPPAAGPDSDEPGDLGAGGAI